MMRNLPKKIRTKKLNPRVDQTAIVCQKLDHDIKSNLYYYWNNAKAPKSIEHKNIKPQITTNTNAVIPINL